MLRGPFVAARPLASRYCAGQPIFEASWTEARVRRRRQAFVVHGRAELAGVGISFHFAPFARDDEVLADQVVHADFLRAGDLDGCARGLPTASATIAASWRIIVYEIPKALMSLSWVSTPDEQHARRQAKRGHGDS